MSSSPNLYLLIALAPLVGAILAGLFGTGFLGRFVSRRGAHLITIAGVLISAIGSVIVLRDVLNGHTYDGVVYILEGPITSSGSLADADDQLAGGTLYAFLGTAMDTAAKAKDAAAAAKGLTLEHHRSIEQLGRLLLLAVHHPSLFRAIFGHVLARPLVALCSPLLLQLLPRLVTLQPLSGIAAASCRQAARPIGDSGLCGTTCTW